MSAIRRNIREGKSTDFWSLPLPRETRTYVPRLLALAIIVAHPEHYPLRFPRVRNSPYLAQVDVGGQMDLKQAATFAGLSLKNLQQLNPGFNHLVTHPNGPYKLVLPIENVEQFMLHLANTSLSHHIDWTQYKIKSGDTLDSVAKRFKTTSYALREINHLGKHSLKKGMKLVIPHNIVSISNEEPKHTYGEMKSGDTLYMVRENDTVEKIAEHFNLPPKMIYISNRLHSYSTLHSGDQLLIPTHLAQAHN